MEFLSLFSVAIAFAMLFFHTLQSESTLASEAATIAAPSYKPTPIVYDEHALHFIAWAEIELAKRARAETVASSADTVKALPTPPQSARGPHNTLLMHGMPLAQPVKVFSIIEIKTLRNGSILCRYVDTRSGDRLCSFLPREVGISHVRAAYWLRYGKV